MRQNTGGYFWDVLLLSQFNENWIDFYLSLCKVLPCQRCIDHTLKYHQQKPIPSLKSQKEKNEYLWKLRLDRGGDEWNAEVKDKGYTLESWEKSLQQPFSRITIPH
jgi:hypothetical protein